MYYSIDGKLVSEKNIKRNKITENFINIPFFQFTSATNAGLKSTKDIESENNAKIKNDIFVDNDANIKGNIVLDGNIIKDEVEINLDNYWIPSNNGKNINFNGNVGIGVSNPSQKLVVSGNTHVTGNQITIAPDSGNYNYFTGTSQVTIFQGQGATRLTAQNGPIAFHAGPTGTNKERMRITSNGNIGIGESNPDNILHVRGNGPQLLLEGKTNENAVLRFSSGPSYGDKFHEIVTEFYAIAGHATKNKMHFKVNEGGESNSPGTRMTIRGDGNIGMGTTNPKQRLDVNGAIRIQQTDKKHNGEGGEIQLAFGDQSKGYRHWHIDVEANNRFRIFKNDAGKVVSGIDITEEGNMSIGGSKANRKLEVAGGLQANSINPFPGNDSGTYYSRWNFYAKKRLTHFICAFQVDHKNIQTTMEIDFSMVYTRSKNGTHNRNQRSAGKLIFNIVSTSPSNKENAGRSDGNWYVRYSCDNSNYVVDGQMGTGPGFYFLRKNDSCYLVAAIGQSRSDGGTYTGMFKVNIMDPFLQGFHMFTDNETKKAEANVEPHECHKYDPNNQRPDNYKEDNFPGEYKFVDKDYHTWMKIGDDTTGSASFKQKYSDRKYDKEIKSPN
tara:strand:+ start:1455 stop:3287 length:1833 start_codon:yes stop_codon:yes gene_type:complete